MVDKKSPADGWPVISGDYIVGDPETGILGAGGGDLIILSMDEINAEIAKVEAAADELMNSLDPNSAP